MIEKREIQNYILFSLIFVVIILLLVGHLIEVINYILKELNLKIDTINRLFNQTTYKEKIFFFGTGYSDLSFLVDLILVFIIILLLSIIILKIYWSVKNETT